MVFADLCPDCNGRGKIEQLQNGAIVEAICVTCDGIGTSEEYEPFQKQARRPKRDFEEDSDE